MFSVPSCLGLLAQGHVLYCRPLVSVIVNFFTF